VTDNFDDDPFDDPTPLTPASDGPEPETDAYILDAIDRHLRVIGPREWDSFRKRFPDTFPMDETGRRKLMRWVKRVRDRSGLDLGPEAHRDENAKVKSRKAVAQATLAVAKHIPTAPPPASMMDTCQRVTPSRGQRIDFLAAISQVFADAEKMRAFSVKPDESAADGEAIKNPVWFDASIKRRLDVLTGAVQVMQQYWDLQRMEDFYTAIIDVIGEVDPETQRRLMVKLSELNARHGMTIHAVI
jgi:hypothetical protein